MQHAVPSWPAPSSAAWAYPGGSEGGPGRVARHSRQRPHHHPPRLFLLTVGVDTFRGQRLGGLICYSIFSLVLQYSVLCRFS